VNKETFMSLAQSPPPSDWPRISSAIVYDDLKAALDWLPKAFGFELRVLVQDGDGNIHHTELEFGGGVVMVSASGQPTPDGCSPKSQSGRYTQSLLVFVDDVDAHFECAKAAGAEIISPPDTRDYGDRIYSCLDPEGHPWYFSQRVNQEAWDASVQEFSVGQS
jgi:uncharacterized glyoxalase superfamily protein PhnB